MPPALDQPDQGLIGLSVVSPARNEEGNVEELVVQGLVIQAFWVLALLGIAQLLWTRGLRRHTAVGG